MTLQQIEYLINGNILPFSINESRISDRLLLQKVTGEGYLDSTWGKNFGHVRAFVGIELDEKGYYINRAINYLTLFLHLYTLKTGQPYVLFNSGLSIDLHGFSNLGVNKISFPGFYRIEFLADPLERDLKFISELKSSFISFESEYESLMISPLGLSLQFFYDAVMSNARWRLELAVVNFMIAAETLVMLEDTGARQLMSKRIGVLASDTPEEINEAYRNMKKLYGVRCGIVHGGGKKALPPHVSESFRYLQKAIQKRLLLRHIPKNELVEKLDQVFEDRTLFNELTVSS